MRRLRIPVLVALVCLFSAAAYAQQASITGIAVDETESRAAGRQRDRDRSGDRPPEHGSHRRQGRVPAAERAARHVHHPGGALGFRDGRCSATSSCWSARTRPCRCTMKLASVSETLTVVGETPLVDTSSSQVAGNVDRRQMEAAAAAGPQLDGAVEAGQGRHRQRRRQQHRHRRDGRPLAAQPRRPADHAESRRLRLRPAALQPRGDRRIPDRHQHVRHHARAVGRHPDPGDLQVGHQHWSAAAPTATSGATASTRPTRSR